MPHQDFPTRLKSARQQKGLSLRDLEDRLVKKLSRQSISQYENGVMLPSRANLLLLCQALEVIPEYFTRPVIELKKVNFRKSDKLPVKEQVRIEAVAKDFLSRYLELENLLGAESQFDNTFSHQPIKNYEQVEEVAIAIRQKWQLGENIIANVIALLENRGIKICKVVADDAFSGMTATIKDTHLIVVNCAEYVPTDRIRFTVLHELAHILLNFETNASDDFKELGCHYFAKAMLLPKESIKRTVGGPRKHISIGELITIKEMYGISIQATLYRLRDLGLISENHLKQQKKMIKARGWKVIEPGKFYGREHSYRMQQLIYRGIAEDLISNSKGANLYGMNLAQFRRMLNQSF